MSRVRVEILLAFLEADLILEMNHLAGSQVQGAVVRLVASVEGLIESLGYKVEEPSEVIAVVTENAVLMLHPNLIFMGNDRREL